MTNTVNIEPSWLNAIGAEFEKEYMRELKLFIKNELDKGKIIYPHGRDIFNAFNMTPFDKVKVVIIGQDPYHGPGQAHGLSFSVKKGVKTPPSLLNIYKEIKQDLGYDSPSHGNLESWAKEGVLLLNSVLTVQKGMAASHRNKGWETFTDSVIEALNDKKEKLVFILWGAPAQKKAQRVDETRHLVLKGPHPSPLSAHRGFFGKKYFSKTNDYLSSHGLDQVNWKLE